MEPKSPLKKEEEEEETRERPLNAPTRFKLMAVTGISAVTRNKI